MKIGRDGKRHYDEATTGQFESCYSTTCQESWNRWAMIAPDLKVFAEMLRT